MAKAKLVLRQRKAARAGDTKQSLKLYKRLERGARGARRTLYKKTVTQNRKGLF